MPKSRISSRLAKTIPALGEGLRPPLHPVDDRQHAGDLQSELFARSMAVRDEPPVVTTSSTIAASYRAAPALRDTGLFRAPWTLCEP